MRRVSHLSGTMGDFESKVVAKEHFGDYIGVFQETTSGGWRIVSSSSGNDLFMSLAKSTVPEQVVFHAHFLQSKTGRWGLRWEADVSADSGVTRQVLVERIKDVFDGKKVSGSR